MRITENRTDAAREALDAELAALTKTEDVTDGKTYHGDAGFEQDAREAANRDASTDPRWYGFGK
jgi:hypothetical protein